MKRFFARFHNLLSALLFISVIAQFLLAGIGVFGAGSLDPHRILGGLILTGSLLLTLVGLAGGSGRATTGASLLLFLLTILQVALIILGDVSRYIAALHPLNALLLLYFSGALAFGRFRAPVPAAAEKKDPVPAGTPSRA